MVRVLGAGILVVACTAGGFRIAALYRRRLRDLHSLLQALRVLRGEIQFASAPLPLAFRTVSDRVSGPCGQLFAHAASAMLEPGVGPHEALTQGMLHCLGATALREEDLQVVKDVGETLGTADRTHEALHLESAMKRLEALVEEARLAQIRHERLWQYGGLLVGLLLAVLLM